MPRNARLIVPDCPHHVTQRGNNRQDIFFVDDDRREFLRLLKESSSRFGLTVEGYCLMPNHVHLVAVPRHENSLHLAMKRVNQLYTQYINRLHGRSGHLWQDRFFSCAMDDLHYWTAMIYVEQNPVRAKMVRQAWRWPWSSAAAHCGKADDAGLLPLARWSAQPAAAGWQEYLVKSQDDSDIMPLRLNTSRGRPLGGDTFISRLERAVGRRLRALPRGRPKKQERRK
jgi:putative transposase